MSAGSEFHATKLEKLKACSLNLVRRRGTTNFGAEHAAKWSPGSDGIAGSTIVRRYSGHVPMTIPYISMTSLYCTRQRIGSQWSWIRLSVTWSDVMTYCGPPPAGQYLPCKQRIPKAQYRSLWHTTTVHCETGCTTPSVRELLCAVGEVRAEPAECGTRCLNTFHRMLLTLCSKR